MPGTTTVLGLTTIVGTDSVDLVSHMSTGISQKMEDLLTGAAYPASNLVIDFNNASNRTLTVKNTGAGDARILSALIDQGGAVYNVMGYGAAGDGVTNDYTAITAAISAASAAGGGVVHFPPTSTSYVLTSGLTVPINVSLLGAGAASLLKYTGATAAITLDPGTGTVTQQRTRLQDFRLTTATGTKGIVLKDVYEVRLDGVIVDGFSTTGIYADATAATGGTFVILLSGCYLRNNATGLQFASQNLHNQWTLVGCRIQGNSGPGIDAVQTVKGLTVVGCDIEGNGTAEIVCTNGAEALVIEGNWFETNTGTNNAVTLQGAGAYNGVVIQGNHFVNNVALATGRALYMPSTAAGVAYKGVQFHGNFINGYGGATNPAIDFVSKTYQDCDFSGNHFDTSTVALEFGNLPAANSNGVWMRAINVEITLDFDLSAVTSQDIESTVSGVAVGDIVALGVPHGSVTADTLFWAWCSAVNKVTVRAMRTAGTPNPASGLFKVAVWRRN